jgi:hypothetical protein
VKVDLFSGILGIPFCFLVFVHTHPPGLTQIQNRNCTEWKLYTSRIKIASSKDIVIEIT